MSRRYWLPIVAVVGLIICGVASAQPQKQPNIQQIEQQAKPPEAQQQRPIETPPAVQEVPSTVSGRPHTAQSQPNEEDEAKYKIWGDTPAQLVMAFAAVLALGLGIWTLVLLALTLRATKDAAEYAKRAAIATEATIEEAKLSAAATIKAADAAYLSAEAAIGMEIPRLHIDSISNNHAQSHDLENWPRRFSPQVAVTNHGRTTAFVSEVILNMRIAAFLPDDAGYTRITQYPEPSVIKAGQPAFYNEPLLKPDIFSEEEIVALLAGDRLLFVWGKIIYTDFLNRPHERVFIWSWKKGAGGFWDRSVSYPNYSYQT